MSEIITVVSGKGGVGKTTLVGNLGIALSELGYSVLLIDADIAMSNLSLFMGLKTPPITLHDVLLGSEPIDAIYDGYNNVKILPSSISMSNFQRVDPERLISIVKNLSKNFDYIIIDSPAGLERNVLAAMSASTQLLLITEPTSPSVADVFKVKIAAEKLNLKVLGFVINKFSNIDGEVSEKDVMKMLELPLYGKIPYSQEIRNSFLLKKIKPLLVTNPKSESANSFRIIAKKIAGKMHTDDNEEEVVKKGFFSRLFGALFGSSNKEKSKNKNKNKKSKK